MRSLTNNYVTFPVIFLMLSAHFPSIYADPYYLPIIFVICTCLVIIKHMMNIYNEFGDWLYVSVAAFVFSVGAVLMLMFIPDPAPKLAPGEVAVAISPEAIIGQRVFNEMGCMVCHQPAGNSIAPTLHRIYGTERRLVGGGRVTADEAYLRESILQSNLKVSYGYAPAMPVYEGVFTDQEVDQLIAYIKSIK
jgi:uncharacterized membrane protein